LLATTGAIFAIAPAWAQSNARPAISIAATISVVSARQTALSIGVGPPEAVPLQSFLRLRGLPPMAALSEGHSIGPGTWAVALTALPNLQLILPAAASGRFEMVITLVALDGTVLTETKSLLMVVTTDHDAPPAASAATILNVSPSGPTPSSAAPLPSDRQTITPQDRDRAQRLLRKGDQELQDGNVAEARLYYRRAADVGLAQAAMALAATYDPAELARLKVHGIVADPKEARRWYERARQLGAGEAEQRLLRLGTQ
jgi:hypothetical protein